MNKLINQLNLGFAQIHTKAVRNEKQYKQLEQLTKESLIGIQKLRIQIKDVAGNETTQAETNLRLEAAIK